MGSRTSRAHIYDIEYHRGIELGHADVFSRIPLISITSAGETCTDQDKFYFELVDELPVTCKEI